MIHLTDEQLEDAMQGVGTRPDHLEQCEKCSRRLAEQEALRGRLQSAFSGIRLHKLFNIQERDLIFLRFTVNCPINYIGLIE